VSNRFLSRFRLEGKEHDLYRTVTNVFRPDGTLLMSNDPWRRERDAEVMRWSKRLCEMIRTVLNGGSINVNPVGEIVAAIELIEKYAP